MVWPLGGLLVLVLWPVAALTGNVGVITLAEGEVHLIRGTGYYTAGEGVELAAEDVIHTGKEARSQLEMADGSLLEVGADSKLYLDEYQLREDKTVEKAEVSLVLGFLRFIASKLEPESKYTVVSNTVTIGIRGTEGVLEADENSSAFMLEEGEVEAFELKDDGSLGQSLPMVSGDFLRRERNRPFLRTAAARKAFRARIPGFMKVRAQQRLKLLKQRGLTPRKLRDIRYDDVARLLRANPRMRKKLPGRFKRQLNNPEFRKRLQQQIQKHPEWWRMIRNRKAGSADARDKLQRSGPGETRNRYATPNEKLKQRRAEREKTKRHIEKRLYTF